MANPVSVTEIDGGAWWRVVFGGSRGNILDAGVMDALTETFDAAARAPRLKAIILEGAGPITSFWFAKYHTLNAFYRYALAREYCSKCPLPLSLPQKPERFQPYIYTNRDIERLIDAADSRHRVRQ